MPDARWSLCTPAGSAGAIAAFQIDGDIDGALSALGLPPMAPGRAALRDLAGIDSGIVVRWSDRTLHLMPHAGAEVQRALADRLTAAGISPAPSASRPAYPEARDRIEDLMLATLARAASPLAIDLLLDQPRRWREGARAGSTLPRDPEGDLADARSLNRLVNPPLVVALGPSNIGKSTLVNALAGRAVSIVADEPGTTRDHVGVMLDLAGLVVRYADTPGLRAGAGPVEASAAELALRLATTADLVLLCGDASHAPPAGVVVRATVTVALRADLGRPSWPADAVVSAPRAEGLRELVTIIRDRLVPPAALADTRPWAFWTALDP